MKRLILSFPLLLLPSIATSSDQNEFYEANFQLQMLSAKSRNISASESYSDFRKNVYKEPFENGVFIVNGDTQYLAKTC